MSRSASVELLAHLAQAATTTCRLLKIKTSLGDVYGMTTLDIPVSYDDDSGDGEIEYSANDGFEPSAVRADLMSSVNNAEGQILLSTELGITQQQVDAGMLDDARWWLYLVNFKDLTMGHMLIDDGDLGSVRTKHGVLFIPELLSTGVRLQQPIGEVWSIRCRAIFGSPSDTPTGCGVDLTDLWNAGEITAVDGDEPSRVFTVSAVSTFSAVPGVLEWLTGNNAGKLSSIEEISGMIVSLVEHLPYSVQAGDTYRIRPDCGKRFLEDCTQVWGNALNFKGEPHIPVGDSAQVLTPEAQTKRPTMKFRSS